MFVVLIGTKDYYLKWFVFSFLLRFWLTMTVRQIHVWWMCVNKYHILKISPVSFKPKQFCKQVSTKTSEINKLLLKYLLNKQVLNVFFRFLYKIKRMAPKFPILLILKLQFISGFIYISPDKLYLSWSLPWKFVPLLLNCIKLVSIFK